MRFPEMHVYSILVVSVAASYMPLKSDDSGKLKNPKCGSPEIPNIPSEEMYGKGISAESRLGPCNHPLKSKLGSCKVGLGIILGSTCDSILFGQQVGGDFPKPSGSSSVQPVITDGPEPSSIDEPLDSSPVSSNNVDTTNVNSGEAVPLQGGRNSYTCYEWPCIFAQNQNLDSVARGFPFTNSNSPSQQLTICTQHKKAGFLSLEDIENTDNYTRITHYIPCRKVTHMYNYCILEFLPRQSSHGNFNKKNPAYLPRVHNLRRWSLLASNENFLKNCETCDKSLEGRDIYIYRGESSFCSLQCRYWRVKAERDLEKATRMVPMAPSPSNKKPIFYKPRSGA